MKSPVVRLKLRVRLPDGTRAYLDPVCTLQSRGASAHPDLLVDRLSQRRKRYPGIRLIVRTSKGHVTVTLITSHLPSGVG